MLRTLIFVALLAPSIAMLSHATYGAQTCINSIQRSAPDERFSINGDGTVTDLRHKLMWSRCFDGVSGPDCDIGTPSKYTWQGAMDAAANSTLAGHDNWRLPNYMEAMSLVEDACYDPALNLNAFPGTEGLTITITTHSPLPAVSNPLGLAGAAIAVFIRDGIKQTGGNTVGSSANREVLLVRDIPPDPSS